MRPWTFVTPSSRGLGLALTRQILKRSSAPVVATTRKSVDETKDAILTGLDGDGDAESRLTVLELDVLGRFYSHPLHSNNPHP